MTLDPSSQPPTLAHLAELSDLLITGTELERLYQALMRHPRVLNTPGSSDVFAACHAQTGQDRRLIEEQLGGLLPLVQDSEDPAARARKTGTLPLPPRMVWLPDVEPPDLGQSVFDAVKRAFHLEDFLVQQLGFALSSARARGHLKLELQLKMILLSTRQRCRLLEERYGFARSRSVLVQGLRRETTRLIGLLHGKERHDID